MNDLNKNLHIKICSIFLLGLTSCTSSNNKVYKTDEELKNMYIKTRTISKSDKIKLLSNETLYSYDYNYGISIQSPIGKIFPNEEIDIPTKNENNQEQQLFTLQDVEKITNDLTNEYNSYLKATSNQYESYINELTNNYYTLENEYNTLLNTISTLPYDNTNSEDIVDIIPEENEEVIPVTREEEIDLIYHKAIESASKNLDIFEPIQGQVPQNEINVDNNNSSKKDEETINLTAENIFKTLKNNITFPESSIKDISFLTNSYNIPKSEILDFKLLSDISNSQNPFEILIVKLSNINEGDLIDKFNLRIDSILNTLPENNINDITDKFLLLTLDDYIIFCFSNINNEILNILQGL